MMHGTNLCSEPTRRPEPGSRLVIARAPLRVSFVGGGSDLPLTEQEECSHPGWDTDSASLVWRCTRCGLAREVELRDPSKPPPIGKAENLGATVSTSINQHVYCVAKWRHDSNVVVNWREREQVATASDIRHKIIRAILISEGLHHGIEITTFADVPSVGSGLGSSAATTCAVLAAVLALKGVPFSGSTLAELAASIELFWLGRSCGKQDHYASAIGGLLCIEWEGRDCRGWERLEHDQYRMARLPEYFLLLSPKGSDEGRDSEEILTERSYSPDFRRGCLVLARSFVARWNEGDLEMLPQLVSDHHKLKSQEFHQYKSKRLEDLEDLEGRGWRGKYKLCGAGRTGHLLAETRPLTRAKDIEELSTIWGPPLPWRPVVYGTQVIHEE